MWYRTNTTITKKHILAALRLFGDTVEKVIPSPGEKVAITSLEWHLTDKNYSI